MADFDQGPSENNITRRRGDTFPILFTVEDQDAAAVDVTSWTFLFTVDENPDPDDELTQVFQIAGVIQDGPNGIVRVGPFDPDDEVNEEGNYFYELQAVDSSSNIRTISYGQFNLVQDVTKDII